mgnify:CR=1 FL=1
MAERRRRGGDGVNCEENKHHDWDVQWYDCFEYISFNATCKVCGANVETNEYHVEVTA